MQEEAKVVSRWSEIITTVGNVFSFESSDALYAAFSSLGSLRWIFRGQARSGWGLETTLSRTVALTKPGVYSSERGAELEAIGTFRRTAARLLQESPGEHDLLGWLFVMRHYGAPTRLMDWTRSPLVALFFALEQPGERGSDGGEVGEAAVWFLNERELIGLYWSAPHGAQPAHLRREGGVEGIVLNDRWYERQSALYERVSSAGIACPLPVFPREFDERMVAQQAAFTCHGYAGVGAFDLCRLESEISLMPPCVMAESGELQDRPVPAKSELPPYARGEIVKKVVFPSRWRNDLLARLARANVTHASLFPGLDGAGAATRAHVQLGWHWAVPMIEAPDDFGLYFGTDPVDEC